MAALDDEDYGIALLLHKINDPAIFPMNDLAQFLRRSLPGRSGEIMVRQRGFDDVNDLVNIFSNIEDKKIVFLGIATHGTQLSLLMGQDSTPLFAPLKDWAQEDPNSGRPPNMLNTTFHLLLNMLKRTLVPEAPILLAACDIGKHPRLGGESKNRTFEIRDACYMNVAAFLSTELPRHPIFCTMNTQVAGELQVRFSRDISTYKPLDPLPLMFSSSKQPMYMYIRETLFDPDDLTKSCRELELRLIGGGYTWSSWTGVGLHP